MEYLVVGQWEDEDVCSELTYHPLEGDDEFLAERRYASVQTGDDGRWEWEVGVVYFYPIAVKKGRTITREDAKVAAESNFVELLINKFEETFKEAVK